MALAGEDSDSEELPPLKPVAAQPANVAAALGRKPPAPPKGCEEPVGPRPLRLFTRVSDLPDPPSEGDAYREMLSQPCDEEYCEQELGYPTWPEEMKDPKYFKDEFERMRTDPRHNKNLGRSMDDQEFWNEAARAPWAKVLLRKEQFWTDRRNVWLEQYGNVMKNNRGREEVSGLLEDCPMDVKRLVAPVLKYKVVETLLANVSEEAKEAGVPFSELMQRQETLQELWSMRKRLEDGGEAEAQRIQDQYDAMVAHARQALAEEKERQEKERGRILIDMGGLKMALEFGQKCKKDGLLEWKRGNWDEALASWRQADDTLRRFRAPARSINENMLLLELHSAVLKNLAQAAIKLERWGEALEAADRVLEMNADDHKAWFRKACALEGVGQLQAAKLCLERIEEIAVGRPDRDRLVRDCEQRRDKLRLLGERRAAEQRRMLQRALRRGIFGGERHAIGAQDEAGAPPAEVMGEDGVAPSQLASGPDTLTSGAPPVAVEQAEAPDVAGSSSSSSPAARTGARSADPGAAADECDWRRNRKRITRDGAWDLLSDLEAAYTDPWFVQRVDKLTKDVCFNARRFMEHLGGVALEAQRSVLEKWGFEASRRGVQEMQAALQDHLPADRRLAERAERATRALYGSPALRMYDRVVLGV